MNIEIIFRQNLYFGESERRGNDNCLWIWMINSQTANHPWTFSKSVTSVLPWIGIMSSSSSQRCFPAKNFFLLTYSCGLSLGEEKSWNGPLAKRGSREDRRLTKHGAKTDPQTHRRHKTKESGCVLTHHVFKTFRLWHFFVFCHMYISRPKGLVCVFIVKA